MVNYILSTGLDWPYWMDQISVSKEYPANICEYLCYETILCNTGVHIMYSRGLTDG